MRAPTSSPSGHSSTRWPPANLHSAGRARSRLLRRFSKRIPCRSVPFSPLTPVSLDHLVAACLAKDREQRFQSAHDVRLQLRWIAETGAVAPMAAAKQKSSRPAWIMAGLLLLIAMMAGIAYFRLAGRPVAVVRSSILPPPGTAFVLQGGQRRSAGSLARPHPHGIYRSR